MTEISEQIIEKLEGFDEEQKQRVLKVIENINQENAQQSIRIAVTIDGVDTQIQCISPKSSCPEALFTPAGVDLVDAIVEHVHTKYNFRFGRVSGKMMLNDVGSAVPLDVERTHTIKFSEETSEHPQLIEVSSAEVNQAMAFHLRILIKNIREHIESILNELESNSKSTNQATIILRGEFRHLRGLDQRIQEATGLKVIVE
jgi:actin-like ATPase involved in cell morphogenesis